MKNEMNVVVICTRCGTLAPYDPPNGNNPWGTWHWHQPCPRCGAEQWAAHDPTCDWHTGRPLEDDELQSQMT